MQVVKLTILRSLSWIHLECVPGKQTRPAPAHASSMPMAAVSSPRISSGTPAASGPMTPGTRRTLAPENGTWTTASASSSMPTGQGRYSASTQPCRLPIMPQRRMCVSPAASQTPTSALKASSKFPSPTRRMPCGEEALANTDPSALTLNARKLLVPQSTAIKAHAPGSSLLTQCNKASGNLPGRVILGLFGSRVVEREAAFRTCSQEKIISRIRALWIGNVFRGRVVLRAGFLRNMKLPECLQSRSLQHFIDHLRRSSLGSCVVHNSYAGMDAVNQRVTRTRVEAMVRDHQDVDAPNPIDRAHEQHFLVPGEIAEIKDFEFAEIDQYSERMRVFAAVGRLGFRRVAVLILLAGAR